MPFRLKPMLLYPLVFIRYSVSKTHVIEKYISLSFCLKPRYYLPMLLCYYVFKTYVIEKYVSLSFCLKPRYYPPMFLCYSVFKTYVLLSHTKAPPR